MSDVEWVITFILNLLLRLLFAPLSRDENRPLIFITSFLLLFSGGVLLTYSLQPQKYDEMRVDKQVIVIYKGDGAEKVEKPVIKFHEKRSYFGGLIKDSGAEWKSCQYPF